MKLIKYILISFTLFFLLIGIVGHFISPVQAHINCDKWLEQARADHESGQNSMAVPKSMLWELDAIYNLQRYQVCRQYGE